MGSSIAIIQQNKKSSLYAVEIRINNYEQPLTKQQISPYRKKNSNKASHGSSIFEISIFVKCI